MPRIPLLDKDPPNGPPILNRPYKQFEARGGITITKRGTPLHSTSNTNTFTMTDAGTPTPNRLLICIVTHRGSANAPDNSATGLTGYGLMWYRIGSIGYSAAAWKGAFVALSNGADSTDPVAGSWAASTTGCHITMYEVDFGPYDLTGIHPLALIQTQNARGELCVTTSGNTTSGSLSLLATPPDIYARPFMSWENEVALADPNPRAAWWELDQGSFTTPDSVSMDAWRMDAFEATASATWASGIFGGLAFTIVGIPQQQVFDDPHARPLRLYGRHTPILTEQVFEYTVEGAVTTTITVDTPGAITWAGATDIALSTTIAPTEGAITWAGATDIVLSVATLSTVSTPGIIAWAGNTDIRLNTTLAVSSGAITWAGKTDITLSVATLVTITTPGAITWTGNADIRLNTIVGVTPGVVTWTGTTVNLVTTIAPAVGAMTWTGQTVGLTTTINPTVGAVTWTGQQVGLIKTINPTVGALTWAGQQLALNALNNISPGNITWTGAGDITVVDSGASPGGATVDKRGFVGWGHPLEQSGRFRR